MKKQLALILVLSVAPAPLWAQASVDVQAGNLSARAQAGVTDQEPADRQVARGARTDDTRNCNSRGVTVRSPNGSSSSSASVSTSPGGSTAVAGGGSSGSHTEYFGCDAPTNR